MMPSSPKSGEQDVKIAPIDDVANIAITVSGQLGKRAATRSPSLTPFFKNHADKEATFALNSLRVIEHFCLPSP